MANKQWKQIGSINESKKGKFYIRLTEEVSLGPDTNVMLQDPRTELDASVEAGRISAEKAEEIKAKIPSFVIYNLVLPPSN